MVCGIADDADVDYSHYTDEQDPVYSEPGELADDGDDGVDYGGGGVFAVFAVGGAVGLYAVAGDVLAAAVIDAVLLYAVDAGGEVVVDKEGVDVRKLRS